MLKYAPPLIALAGLAFGLYVVRTGAKAVPVAQPVVEPSLAPFKHHIAGSGIVEPASENIQISTTIPGVVTEIPVSIGQRVAAGDLLFKIDTRDLDAELVVRQAAVDLARARLPEAQSSVDDTKQSYDLYRSVDDPRAISQEEMNRRKFALSAAESRLAQARADVVSSEALVSQTKAEIGRRSVKAPISGEILQRKIHLGEFAQVGPLSTPLMVLGETDDLVVRTDIDENDAWRFSDRARAVAFVRGNPNLSTPLTFVRVEPYVIPKRSLTGDTMERVDTRVLQVLFRFKPDKLKVFVGQQMDVYIEVPEPTLPRAATTQKVATTQNVAATAPSR